MINHIFHSTSSAKNEIAMTKLKQYTYILSTNAGAAVQFLLLPLAAL